MPCKVCKSPGKKENGLVLCRRCRANLEQAIKRWRVGIERDLATLEAFDAYCAEREQITA